MHLCHKSIPGLLLNQPLIKELSCHCAFCHCQIAARSIHKHYTDQHPLMVTHADQYQSHVLGLANIGSGRGRCSFCDKECRNVRSHECGVLFQLSAMLGYTFQPEHFPVMPVMMKASRDNPMNASPQSRSIPAAPSPHSPGAHQVIVATPVRPAAPSVGDALVDVATHKPKQTIFVCPQCHSSFLTATGLEKHLQSHDPDAEPVEPELNRASKMPRVDTIQAMLNRVPADIPIPPKTFLCPLCQIRIGRKGLAGHLRNVHQVDKPEFFSFRPSRDMTPGRLGCSHCMSCFTIEAALKLHFARATCPALLTEWVKDMHFGPTDMTSQSQQSFTESSKSSVALEQLAPPIADPDVGLTAAKPATRFGHCGLQMPLDTPAWHSMLTHVMCARSVDGQSSVDVPMTLPFGPEQKLSWYDHFAPWLAHFTALPQVQIADALSFRLLHACAQLHPIFWAWSSDELVTVQHDRVPVHDDLHLQHHLF